MSGNQLIVRDPSKPVPEPTLKCSNGVAWGFSQKEMLAQGALLLGRPSRRIFAYQAFLPGRTEGVDFYVIALTHTRPGPSKYNWAIDIKDCTHVFEVLWYNPEADLEEGNIASGEVAEVPCLSVRAWATTDAEALAIFEKFAEGLLEGIINPNPGGAKAISDFLGECSKKQVFH